MEQQSLSIGFRNCQVTIQTHSEKILTAMKRRFREMIVEGGIRHSSMLNVTQQESGFLIAGREQRYTFPDALRQLEYETIHALIQGNLDLLWIHSGCIALGSSAILAVGKSGCGKSSLVLNLARRGWWYLTDDIAPVELSTHRVFPFLRTPLVREPVQTELPPERIAELHRTQIDLDQIAICPHEAKLETVFFPIFKAGSELLTEPLSGSEATLELLKYTLNFDAHRLQALTFFAELSKQLTFYRVTYSEINHFAEFIVSLKNAHMS